jgi:hypothetical protein
MANMLSRDDWTPDRYDFDLDTYLFPMDNDVKSIFYGSSITTDDSVDGVIQNNTDATISYGVYVGEERLIDGAIFAGDSFTVNVPITLTDGTLEVRMTASGVGDIYLTPTSGPTPPDPPSTSSDEDTGAFLVYELDRGWSFDGNYIPHFVELNWYFGENPFAFKGVEKVRIHGLTKGTVLLKMAAAGMQTEYDSDYTEAQYVDLPLNPIHVSSDFLPITNYVDSSNWGISVQLKFEGRNTDIAKPEPAHVIQVLAIQSSPADTGATAN